MKENKKLKDRIVKGWDCSAAGFTKAILRDLQKPLSGIWTDLILSSVPYGGRLNILDVGTGPGVFSILMTRAGHDVTGIDISENMIAEAKANSEKYGVSAKFIRMDSDDLLFDDYSFDMVISRNVVWVMPDPQKVYREWFRVLKHGGRIVVFDEMHEQRSSDYDPKEKARQEREEYIKRFHSDQVCSYDMDNYEIRRGFKSDLPLTYLERPLADIGFAKNAGFTSIEAFNIDDRISIDDITRFEHEHYHNFKLSAIRP